MKSRLHIVAGVIVSGLLAAASPALAQAPAGVPSRTRPTPVVAGPVGPAPMGARPALAGEPGQLPPMPVMPAMPPMPVMPDMPPMPVMPEMPPMPVMPVMPQIPPMPVMPEMPIMPIIPPMPMIDFPVIPDVSVEIEMARMALEDVRMAHPMLMAGAHCMDSQ